MMYCIRFCVYVYLCGCAVVYLWLCSVGLCECSCMFVCVCAVVGLCVQLYVCVCAVLCLCVCAVVGLCISVYIHCAGIYSCVCVCVYRHEVYGHRPHWTQPSRHLQGMLLFLSTGRLWKSIAVCALLAGEENMLCSQLCSMDCEKGDAELNRILYIFPLHDDRVTSMSQSSFLLNKFEQRVLVN